jgi:hypothetical protein
MIIKTKSKYILFILVVILIGLGMFWFHQKTPGIEVSQTNPLNNAQDVGLDTKIVIIFNKTPDKTTKTKIAYKIDPETNIKSSWNENKLILTPEKELMTNTTYEILITYKNKKIYYLSFKTTLLGFAQSEKEIGQQAEDALAFGDAYKKFIDEYPWYRKLPLENKFAIVVYLFKEKSFRITFLQDIQGEQKQKEIVNDVLDSLKQIGVPEPINYYIVPFESP